MTDDLMKRLRDGDEFERYMAGPEAADRIEELEAELAYYKGVHDGIYSTGTHVVVPVEPTEAMLTRARISNGETRYAFDIKPIYRAMIRAAQEKVDG